MAGPRNKVHYRFMRRSAGVPPITVARRAMLLRYNQWKANQRLVRHWYLQVCLSSEGSPPIPRYTPKLNCEDYIYKNFLFRHFPVFSDVGSIYISYLSDWPVIKGQLTIVNRYVLKVDLVISKIYCTDKGWDNATVDDPRTWPKRLQKMCYCISQMSILSHPNHTVHLIPSSADVRWALFCCLSFSKPKMGRVDTTCHTWCHASERIHVLGR